MSLLVSAVLFYMLFQAGPIVRTISWVGYFIFLGIFIALLWSFGAFEYFWLMHKLVFNMFAYFFSMIFG